jgi:hypothetical protein
MKPIFSDWAGFHSENGIILSLGLFEKSGA